MTLKSEAIDCATITFVSVGILVFSSPLKHSNVQESVIKETKEALGISMVSSSSSTFEGAFARDFKMLKTGTL